MRRKRFFKYLFVCFLLVLLLTGCTIVITTPVYHPEKTVYTLQNAVRTENRDAIKACFLGNNIWVKSDSQEQFWTNEQATNFFYFLQNKYAPATTQFDFGLKSINISTKNDTAVVFGSLEMKGLREINSQIFSISYDGFITFYLERLYGDNWRINGFDLSLLSASEPIAPNSIY